MEWQAASVERGIEAKRPQLSTSWIVSDLIERHGWCVEAHFLAWRYLARRVASAELEHGNRVRAATGYPPNRPADPAFADERYKADVRRAAPLHTPVPLMPLFDVYVRESGMEPASEKSARQCLSHLTAFLKHDDASKVTPDDIVRWKEHLLIEDRIGGGGPREARTIRDKYLASARALYAWAYENLKIRPNPVDGIGIRVPKKPKLREKGFTDAEAKTILDASSAYGEAHLPCSQGFARRWVPWLCAYTGARVAEITQLRAQDVSERSGFYAFESLPRPAVRRIRRRGSCPCIHT